MSLRPPKNSSTPIDDHSPDYHLANGGDLRRHLLYLRRHYRVLHLEAGLEELCTPNKGGPQRRDRRTPLVLTFDDGYHDNYTHGYKLACELEVPITIFLVTLRATAAFGGWRVIILYLMHR